MSLADCLFCQIAAKRIPAAIVHDDDEFVAFHDLHPQAPVHVVVIPRRHVARLSEWPAAEAAPAGRWLLTAAAIARTLQVAEAGYRVVINCNAQAGQTVFHAHLHLLGGRPMRWPPG